MLNCRQTFSSAAWWVYVEPSRRFSPLLPVLFPLYFVYRQGGGREGGGGGGGGGAGGAGGAGGDVYVETVRILLFLGLVGIVF